MEIIEGREPVAHTIYPPTVSGAATALRYKGKDASIVSSLSAHSPHDNIDDESGPGHPFGANLFEVK